MTAAVAAPRISPFTASRDQPCTSSVDCDGVKVGQDAAYVGWTIYRTNNNKRAHRF